jgi:hypothetical protein
VAALLVASGVATAVLAGAAAAVLAALLHVPAPGPWPGAALVLAAVAADLAGVRPLAVPRQVPRAWGRLFPPAVVAVLYGARLGVGPLTLLPTWLWWAVSLTAAAAGPVPAMVTGATFAATRALTMLVLAEAARPAMPARMARIRAAGPRAATLTTAAAVLLTATALLP